MVRINWLYGLGLSLSLTGLCSAQQPAVTQAGNAGTPAAQSAVVESPTVPQVNVDQVQCTQPGTCTPAAPESVFTPGCGTYEVCDATDSKLFGLFARSDHQFDCFISPMTNPVYFEDPRTLTEARLIFANHHLPTALGGQNVQLVALQARAALTENLSIIATKDGFFFSQNPLLDDGFADVNAGLKYNLYKDVESQTLLSTGFTFGIPLGTTGTLQGRGSGEFNLFLSGAKQIGDYWHVISTFGARIPADTALQSQST